MDDVKANIDAEKKNKNNGQMRTVREREKRIST